ncbi:MAG: phosphoribosylanthranilate isomerase [Rikenellaceae bacterium]|nr:phosphoribosylanthranilate isomerase [Rikenellaceae bacterium]
MLIKVCGTADYRNMLDVARLGPDMMGFIFYRPSPRNAFGLSPQKVRALPGQIEKIGVFVDERQQAILDTAERYGLGTVQLHGGETPELCRSLRSKGMKVIKALGISAPQDLDSAQEYAESCDLLLFDTKTPLRGGSGRKFDHGVLAAYRGPLRFLVGGGIGPEDTAVAGAIGPLAAGVDINSRFEIIPGVKDITALGKFISTIRKNTTL